MCVYSNEVNHPGELSVKSRNVDGTDSKTLQVTRGGGAGNCRGRAGRQIAPGRGIL